MNIIVSGVVQGVGFRYFVYTRATQYKLVGVVRNLFDGNVEIDVEGERSLIEELIKDVRVGPRSAHVVDVKVSWKNVEHKYKNFKIY